MSRRNLRMEAKREVGGGSRLGQNFNPIPSSSSYPKGGVRFFHKLCDFMFFILKKYSLAFWLHRNKVALS